MTRLLDFLIGITDALWPPWRRCSAVGHPAVGLLVVVLAGTKRVSGFCDERAGDKRWQVISGQ